MGLTEIVAALDDEISRLQQARSLLAGTTNGNVTQACNWDGKTTTTVTTRFTCGQEQPLVPPQVLHT